MPFFGFLITLGLFLLFYLFRNNKLFKKIPIMPSVTESKSTSTAKKITKPFDLTFFSTPFSMFEFFTILNCLKSTIWRISEIKSKISKE